jgi:hypothetical protein
MAGRQAARRVALTGPVTVTGTLGVGAGAAGSWLPLPVGAVPDGAQTAGTSPELLGNRQSAVRGSQVRPGNESG